VAARLMNKDEEQKMEHELEQKYESMRDDYNQAQAPLLTIEEARKRKPELF